MSAYLEPLKIAVLTFPFLAFFVTLPFLIWHYRKYGSLPIFRGIVLYSFVFYLLCTYFLVILPLPAREVVAQMTGPRMELHLGASWQHFWQQTTLQLGEPRTYLGAMRQSVFLEPLFNSLLVLPFGIFMRYYFRLRFWPTVALSFALSLFFEVTQLTGLYFIYPRSYRLFDVNDLVHNTIGGALGYFLTPVFTMLLPQRDEMDEKASIQGTRVSYLRRAVAVLLDWMIVTFVSGVGQILYRVVSGQQTASLGLRSLGVVLLIISYFMVLPTFTNGWTLGKKMVRIRLVQEGHSHIQFWRLFQRYGILYFLYFGIGRIGVLLNQGLNSAVVLQVATSALVIILISCLQVAFIVQLAWSIVTRKRRLFYEVRSHTYHVSTIQPKSVN